MRELGWWWVMEGMQVLGGLDVEQRGWAVVPMMCRMFHSVP